MFSRVNILVFLLIVVIDQYTKFLAATHLVEGVPVPIIPNLFNLTLVFNPGAAFGMFGGLPTFWRRFLLILVSAVALCIVVFFLRKSAEDDRWSQLALIGILAGAFGNIVDRIRFDAVVDFLDFYWGQYHWPAFNVADSCICVGVGVLVVKMFIADFVSSGEAVPAEK